MAGSIRVELFEGTDSRNNTRTTILKREDRPHMVVAFGACIEDDVRYMIESAERRLDLCRWSFAEEPAAPFYELTKLGEYTLHLKEK